jgi:Tfp pilus assembly protein FimV
VFDTETLAAIYVNQGFYTRAAEIYRRLAEQHPGDERLRRTLDDVLAREREERRAAAATASPVEERIRRLQVLLDAFKGGRPQ